MTDKEKETELTAKFLEPGFKSPFGVSQEQLLALVHMDRRAEQDGVVESSALIMGTYGGPEGLAASLKTSAQTGIRWSDQERSDRE